MSAGNIIIFYIGILLIPSIKQIFTKSECDITKGDCVNDYKRESSDCKSTCFRNPGNCGLHVGIDLFGKEQKYQCHCKHLIDCQFQILSECKNGCLPGYEEPYCQKRKYHEFIKNESITNSFLFSAGNTGTLTPRIVIHFRNKYRVNTVEIYSNYEDATMKVSYPHKMECKLKRTKSMTVCTGDVKANSLYIDGEAGVSGIKLFGCPPALYGKNCTNKCHCSGGANCHQLSGACENGCEDGWYGKKCNKQTYVNIAQGKRTNQTSIYGGTGTGTRVFHNGTCMDMKEGMTSDKAVDGNFDPGFTHKSCANTKKEYNPHWQVMFDKPYLISQLIIYNRMTNHYRLRGFKVYLGSSLCFESKNNEHEQQVIHIKCQKPVNSSNVKISLPPYTRSTRMLTLCEVEVLQCVPGFYGDMCKESCELCVGSKCDQITGRCEKGCRIGYYRYDRYQKCIECLSGSFGQDCKKSCHCPKTCNHINGSCPDKCDAGYSGFNCQDECEVGRFGRDCKDICHCVDNNSCDKKWGTCQGGCSAGYRGKNCQTVCSRYKFGLGCKQDCHCSKPCNHINGSCPGDCRAGYSGFNCQKECEVDRFGVNCRNTCHCIDNKKCDRINGECKGGCSAGYLGNDCQQVCSHGNFGPQCKHLCHCSKPCNHIDGSCPGECEAGYSGSDCQKECEVDRFGVNCYGSCHCVDNKNCNRQNGTCPDGCAAGYKGDNCQKAQRKKSILMFVLVPLFLLLLIIGIVAAFCYWKNRPIAKRVEKIHKVSENRNTETIPEDTAHLYEEIQMNESEGIYVNMASTSFKANLMKYVSEKKQEVEPFNDEFLRLPKALPLPHTEATKPENTKKNRYKTILPYDHSRVKLQPDEISSSDYINANFISNQRYIACQGPTQNTLIDFWRMIWQVKCNTIVMLTDIVENGKMKCMQYWPDDENTESFGTIQVTHINTSYHSTYIHRRFIISKTGVYQNESWTIDHLFFNKWPDHGIPQHAEYILEFRNALKYREGIITSLVVHCSAGVGRTGTYICIDILLNEMLSGEAVDVLECITKLREDRMHMVQKRIQLVFIYDVLVENILTGDYDIDVNNIPKEFSRLKETDNSTRVSILEHQFQDLIKQVELRGTSITLKEEEYANFNINGFFIDGPSCEKEFLVTNSPNEDKTVDFLKCIRKRGYLNIVTFDSSGNPPNYLPRSLNETVKIGPYLLELISVEGKDICIHHVLKVECDNNSRIEEFEVNHFLVTIWTDSNYPSCADILKLSSILSTHQNEQLNKKIAVNSGGNFHKSGLMCIIHILKTAIASQSVINIVRLVRLIKKIQPNIVPDCESYAYIWEVAEYLQDESSLYSNFVQ